MTTRGSAQSSIGACWQPAVHMRPHRHSSVCVRQQAEQAVAADLCGLKHLVLRSDAGGERLDQEAAFGRGSGHFFNARTAICRYQAQAGKAECRMSVYLCESLPNKITHSVH